MVQFSKNFKFKRWKDSDSSCLNLLISWSWDGIHYSTPSTHLIQQKTYHRNCLHFFCLDAKIQTGVITFCSIQFSHKLLKMSDPLFDFNSARGKPYFFWMKKATSFTDQFYGYLPPRWSRCFWISPSKNKVSKAMPDWMSPKSDFSQASLFRVFLSRLLDFDLKQSGLTTFFPIGVSSPNSDVQDVGAK